MSLNVGELEATLKLKTELDRQLETLQAKLRAFGLEFSKVGQQGKPVAHNVDLVGDAAKRLAGYITAGAIVKWGADLFAAAGHLQDLKERTDFSIAALQRFGLVAEQGGSSLEAVSSAAFQMSRRLAGGDDAAAEAVRELGMEFATIRNMKPEKAFEVLGIAIGKIDDPMKQAEVGAKLFGKSVQELLPVFKHLKDAGDPLIELTEDQVGLLDDLGDAYVRAKASIVPLIVQWVDAKFNITGLVQSIQALRGQLGDLPKVQGPATEGANKWSAAMAARTLGSAPLTAALDHEKDIITDLTEQMRKKSEQTKKNTEDTKRWTEAAKALESGFAGIPNELLKIGTAVDVADFVQTAKDLALVEQNAHIANFGFRGMWEGLDQIGEKTTVALDAMDGWAFVGPKIEDAGRDLRGFGEILETDVIQRLADFPSVLARAFEGGGDLSGAFKSLASGLGSDLTDALTEDDSVWEGLLGGGIGLAMAGVGALIEYFGDARKRDFERMGQEWGVSLSEGLAEELQEQFESGAFLTELAAINNALKKIIEENGGLDTGNLEMFTSKLRDTFVLVGTGQIDAAQAAKVLDENWAIFIATATDGNGRLSAGLKEIIQLNEQYGTQSKEIRSYVLAQTNTAIDGYAQVLAGLVKQIDAGEHAQQNLADLGAQALVTFNAAIDGGMSTADALDQIGPSLSALQEEYTRLGLNVDDVALKNLLFQNQFVSKNPELINAVGGLTSQMVALDNIGRETVGVFEAQQRTGYEAFLRIEEQVLAMGHTSEDALGFMQLYLQQATQQAELLGVPLDDNTARLIEQSREMGLWKDKGKGANDELIAAIERLADKMGGFNEQISQTIRNLARLPDSVPSPWHDWQPPPPPPRYDVPPIEEPWANWSPPPMPDYGAVGGLVTDEGIRRLASGAANLQGRVLAFTPRGTDVIPAMLSPGESVLTPSATQVLGVDTIGRLNRGQEARVIDMSAVVAELKALRADQQRLQAQLLLLPDSISMAQRDALLVATA